MPAFGEDWLIEAEDYCRERYNMSLEELGIDPMDGENFYYDHEYVVDNLYALRYNEARDQGRCDEEAN